jgi:hypothetical protein
MAPPSLAVAESDEPRVCRWRPPGSVAPIFWLLILQLPRGRHSEQRDGALHARFLAKFIGDGQQLFVRRIEQGLAKCCQQPLESEFGSCSLHGSANLSPARIMARRMRLRVESYSVLDMAQVAQVSAGVDPS